MQNTDEFDDISQLGLSTRSRAKRSEKRKKARFRPRKVLPGQHINEQDLKHPKSALMELLNMLGSKSACNSQTILFGIAVLLSMMLEIFDKTQRYNIIVILALAGACTFPGFPLNSIRPQVILSMLFIASFTVDIIHLINNEVTILSTGLMTALLLLKVIALSYFYGLNKRNMLARKYLHRRLRLFYIPFFQPRRIMRDIRARIVAIGLLQICVAIAFLTFWILSITFFDYSDLYLPSKYGYFSLSTFLIVKSVSSIVVVSIVLYDTDVVLSLWYFGFLGFAVHYVREYIREKRMKLHGWPLMLSFYIVRFHILCAAKVLDVLWGVVGWIIFSNIAGTKYSTLEWRLQVYFSWILLILFLSDFWCSTLFLGIRWLWHRQKVLREINDLDDSDDSEIDEFHLRIPLEKQDEIRIARFTSRKIYPDSNESASQNRHFLRKKPALTLDDGDYGLYKSLFVKPREAPVARKRLETISNPMVITEVSKDIESSREIEEESIVIRDTKLDVDAFKHAWACLQQDSILFECNACVRELQLCQHEMFAESAQLLKSSDIDASSAAIVADIVGSIKLSGFSVIAAGRNGGSTVKIYFYAYAEEETVPSESVLCLFEMSLNLKVAYFQSKGNYEGAYHITVDCRSTNPEYNNALMTLLDLRSFLDILE